MTVPVSPSAQADTQQRRPYAALLARDPVRVARLLPLIAEVEPPAEAQPPGQRQPVVVVDLAPGEALPPGEGRFLVLADRRDLEGDPRVAALLPRDAAPALLQAALQAVAAGLVVRMPGAIAPSFAPAAEDEARTAPHALLTPRELEILAVVGEGLSNKQVARRLGISAHTVKFHLEAVFAKLGVGRRAEAVAKGLRHGLIEL